MNNNSGIITEFGPVTVDHIKEHKYKPGIWMAQIRQDVTKIYPAVRVGNSKSDLLVPIELPKGKAFPSTRVTWTPVKEGLTIPQVQAILDNKEICPEPRIYRIISTDCEDVLTEEQLKSIESGLRTMEEYEESHRICARDGSELPGPPQYSQNFFSKTGREDEDYRPNNVRSSRQGTAVDDASQTMGPVGMAV